MQYSLSELESIVPEPNRPDDFDSFWRSTLAEIARTPIDWSRSSDPDIVAADGRPVDVIEFSSIEGRTVYGWFASSPTQPSTGFLTLPGYSLGNPKPVADLLYPGVSTFCINLHGNHPSTPYVHPTSTDGDYVVHGIESPKTYIFRRFIAHALVALQVLAAQPEVDADRLVVGGASQGGGLALVIAALAGRGVEADRNRHCPPGESAAAEGLVAIPSVRMCLPDIPWLCDLDRSLALCDLDRYRSVLRDNPAARLPDARMRVAFCAEDHPDEADRIYRTYRYIDPLNHAQDIACPVLITAGGRDPSCRPPTVYSVFNAIKSHKEMVFVPNAGHEIVSEMTAAHSRWLAL